MKQFKTIAALLLFIPFLASCTFYGYTDNELKAIDEVLKFYGGSCSRDKGIEKIDGVEQHYFQLEISESKLIESFSKRLQLPASNIAFIFWSNITVERDFYTHVRVTINTEDKNTRSFSFSTEELKEMEMLIPMLTNVTQIIRAKKHEMLLPLFELKTDSLTTLNNLKAECYTYDLKYGDPYDIQFQGCFFYTDKTNNRPMAHLTGMMIRKKGNIFLSLFIDRKSHKIIDLKFKFRGLTP
jgi:hypothetical protein